MRRGIGDHEVGGAGARQRTTIGPEFGPFIAPAIPVRTLLIAAMGGITGSRIAFDVTPVASHRELAAAMLAAVERR